MLCWSFELSLLHTGTRLLPLLLRSVPMPGTEGGQYANVSSIYDFTLAVFKNVTVQLGVSSVDLLLACVGFL